VLDANNYVEEIENEKKFVTIIIHIYDNKFPACEAMNGCLQVSSLCFSLVAVTFGNVLIIIS